jgi:phosphoglycerate kinase
MIKSVDYGFFQDKRVLVRVDFNVPIGDDFRITDHTRIIESLPTIDKIIDDGGIPVLMSHLGRPKGVNNHKYSLKPVADYLSNHIGYDVIFASDCIGLHAVEAVRNASRGNVVLLENLRFHKGEEKNDDEFAEQLAELGDVYVNDAFGTAHRAHASTYGLAKLFHERYAGYLLEAEIKYLDRAINRPKRPLLAIIGGAKISGKIDVIKNLMNKCDKIIVGGGMMFTFYKAMGYEIGHSILEELKVELAREILEEAKAKNVNLILPVDVVVTDRFDNDSPSKVVKAGEINKADIGMDIGPETISLFEEEIKHARTIIWNGPMGVFEMSNFSKGTLSIGQALSQATVNGTITVVGGGDSVAAITQMGLNKKVSHVSTGGGASLEYLEGIELPGIKALETNE